MGVTLHITLLTPKVLRLVFCLFLKFGLANLVKVLVLNF